MHEKYTYKDGKKYGPYLYETKRVDGKIVTTYLGERSLGNKLSTSKLFILFGLIFFVSIFIYFFYLKSNSLNGSLTGKISIDVNLVYKLGEPVDGKLKFNIKEGELVPENSKVKIDYDGQSKIVSLSSLINDATISGDYYAENSELSGSGEGYGVIGNKITYPTVSFKVLVYDNGQSTSSSSSDSNVPSSSEDIVTSTDSNVGSDVGTPSSSDSSIVTSPESSTTTSTESGSVTETGTDSSVSSVDSSSSSDSNVPSSSEDTGGSLTGAVSSETEYTIDGSVSYGNEFSYNLAEGKSARIVEGSVNVDGNAVPDQSVSLNADNGQLIVSTDYFVNERGFGKDFLGDYALTLEVDVLKLGLNAVPGDITISLVYEDAVLASQKKEVSTLSSPELSPEIEDTTEIIPITLVQEIGTIRIPFDGSTSIDLSQYFSGADSYSLEIPNIDVRFDGAVATLTPESGFKGARTATVVAFNEKDPLGLGSNEFNVLVSSGALRIETSHPIVKVQAGKKSEDVLWEKKVSLESEGAVSIPIPAEAKDVVVKAIDESGNEIVQDSPDITPISGSTLSGNVVIDLELRRQPAIVRWYHSFVKALTGRAVDNRGTDETTNLDVELDGSAKDYVIEYSTEGPIAFETETDRGKIVTVSSSDSVHLTDVLVSSNLDDSLRARPEQIHVYWKSLSTQDVEIKAVEDVPETILTVEDISSESATVAESSDPGSSKSGVLTGNVVAESSDLVKVDDIETIELPVDAYNLNGDPDDYVDYLEFIAPHLSNQTFEIIIVVSAEHLDENRTFVSDIYDSVKELDGNWSETISDGHYVYVTFERNLTNVNDITIYPRIVSGTPRIDVFEAGGNVTLATFSNLNENQYNKIYLTNLSVARDDFDLRVVGGSCEFDHIIDPFVDNGSLTQYFGNCANFTTVGATYYLNQTINPPTGGVCLNATVANITIDCAGYSITGSSFTKPIIQTSQNGLTVRNCNISAASSVGGIGIKVDGPASYVSIINSSIWGRLGIQLTGTGTSFYLANISIVNAGGPGCTNGISISGNPANSTIINSTLSGCTGNLIAAATNTLVNWTISQSRFVSSGGANSVNLQIESSVIDANNISSNTGGSGLTISAGSGPNNVIKNNIFSRNANVGVKLLSDNLTISVINNTFFGSKVGLNVSNSYYGIIANNFFDNNTIGLGVYWPSAGNNISNNTINRSTSAALRIDGTPVGAIAGDYVFTSSNNTFYNISVTNPVATSYDIQALSDSLNTASLFTLVNSYFSNYSFTIGVNATFRDTRFGEIAYTRLIIGNGTNLSNTIFILNNSAYFTEEIAGLNKSANITLYGIPQNLSNPIILRNGVDCGSACYNFTNLSAGTVLFNVSYGGNYTINSSGNLDTTSPEVTINSPTGNLSTSQVTFNVTTNENAGAALFSLNSGVTNLTMQKNGNTDFNYTNSSIADGNYVVNFYVNDTTGNMNRTTSRAFTIDTITPALNLTYPLNTTYTSTQTTLNYTVSDTNLQACWYFNGTANNTITCGNNATTLLYSNEGTNTWIVYANDTLGHLNTSRVTFSVVTTAPNFTITSPLNTTYITNNITVNFTSSDVNGISARWFYNGTANETYTGAVYRTASQGSNTWIFYSNNTFNTLNSTSITFSVDSITPQVQFVTPTETDSSTITRNNIVINVTATDSNLVNISIKLYNSTGLVNQTTTSSSPNFINVTSLPDGTYTFNATATDGLNNRNTTDTRTVTITTSVPGINLTYPLNTSYTTLQTALNYTVTNSPQACWYSTDLGVTNTTVTCGTNLTGLTSAQGSNTWKVYANNTAGVQNSSNVTFFVDSITPQIQFVIPTETNGMYLARNTFLVNVTSSDTNLANITILVYNSTGLYNSSFSATSPLFLNYTSVPDGSYYFNSTVRDVLNNANYTETRNVTIDTTAPVLAYGIGTPETNSYLSGDSIYVNVSLNETNFGNITFALYNFSSSGAGAVSLYNLTTYSTPIYFINWTGLPNKKYRLNVSVNDLSGNNDKLSNRLVVLDTLAPQLTVTSPTNTTYTSNSISINFDFSSVAAGSEAPLESLWFFNGTANESYVSAVSRTYSSGSHVFIAYGNDSAGNVGNTTVYFSVSVPVPGINLTYPLNTTYTTVQTALNYTVTNSPQACWYSTDLGVTNTTVTCGTNLTGLTSAQGSNTWKVYANSTTGSINSSSVTFVVDSYTPQVNFGIGTDNSGEVVAGVIYVNSSINESNVANVTYNLYNSTARVNSTTFSSLVPTFNFTNLADGTYTYQINVTDILNNKNGTSTRSATSISSCLNSICSEDAGCIVNSTCALYSGLCTGGICDFVNLTVQNATLYTLYDSSGNGNSLVLNITSNLSNAVRFFNVSQIIFSGKNGSTISPGTAGGNGSIINITVTGLFNRTQARFIGLGGYTTLSSGAGGNGGILQINYHGLIRNNTVTQFISGNSSDGTSGSPGSQLLVKDSACPRDTDVTDPAGSNSSLGIINSADINFITLRYGNVSSDSTYHSSADVNCDNVINIIDLAKVGFTFGTR